MRSGGGGDAVPRRIPKSWKFGVHLRRRMETMKKLLMVLVWMFTMATMSEAALTNLYDLHGIIPEFRLYKRHRPLRWTMPISVSGGRSGWVPISGNNTFMYVPIP